jgi:hypothetical protein
LVGGFVQHERGALDLVAGGGRGSEQDGFFAQEGGAGVLHAAEWKAGNQDEVVFAGRGRALEVLGHVPHAGARDLDGGRLLGGAVEFRLAHEEAKALAGDDAEGSGGEGEQVGGKGLRFGEIGQAEAGLRVCAPSTRVLETTVQVSGAVMSRWKRAFRSGWSKQGKAWLASMGTNRE